MEVKKKGRGDSGGGWTKQTQKGYVDREINKRNKCFCEYY